MDFGTSLVMGAVQLLAVVIDIAGIVIAVARWTRHPTVSMLVVVSMGIGLIVRGGYFVLPRVMDLGDGRDGYLLATAGLSFVSTLAFGLLVAAVFVERHTGAEAPTQRW